MATEDETAMFNIVKALSELPGPVGHEDAVQNWINDRWSSFCPEVKRTRVNNIIARVGGSGPRLLIMGHADEICFLVKSISDDGFLHIWPYYADQLGHPPRSLVPINQPALVLTNDGTVEGVFATASGHVSGGQRAKQNEPANWNDWFIDIGASSRAEAEGYGIYPGCRIIWNPPTRRLGRSHIVGKAMDDRAALSIATLVGEALSQRDNLAYEVWLASVIQEENGLLGASSVQDTVEFDRCINLDVGLTGDIPGPDPRDFPCRLGAGPTLAYKDNTAHYSRRMTEELFRVAQQNEIPVQRAIFANYGSDGSALIRRGVETVLLTYPTRYTHSPIETVDEIDLQNCVDLIVAFATASPEVRH